MIIHTHRILLKQRDLVGHVEPPAAARRRCRRQALIRSVYIISIFEFSI